MLSPISNLAAGHTYNDQGANVKLTDLRGILQYVPQFREKTFIIAVDGVIVTDENFANILLDVAVLRSLNIRVVLVHGAAAQIKALAEKQGVQPSNLDGTGVTDAPTLQLAMDAANRLTHEILQGLSANDLRAACTNAIVAHPLGIIQGVDHLFTGKVQRVDTELLQTLLNRGIVPVLPPLGFDGDGKTYRVNSDSIALAVAEALKASKLIFITARGWAAAQRSTHSPDAGGGLAETCPFGRRRVCGGNAFQGFPCGGRLRGGRGARPHCQRPRR